jgi:hypothetical protein
MGSGADIVWEKCGKCGEEYNEEYIHVCAPKKEWEEQDAKDNALSKQVDGNHYKDLAIQPMEYSFKNKLDPAQHTAIKYVTRFRNKGGRRDLEKAIHCIEMLIELEYGG